MHKVAYLGNYITYNYRTNFLSAHCSLICQLKNALIN